MTIREYAKGMQVATWCNARRWLFEGGWLRQLLNDRAFNIDTDTPAGRDMVKALDSARAYIASDAVEGDAATDLVAEAATRTCLVYFYG